MNRLRANPRPPMIVQGQSADQGPSLEPLRVSPGAPLRQSISMNSNFLPSVSASRWHCTVEYETKKPYSDCQRPRTRCMVSEPSLMVCIPCLLASHQSDRVTPSTIASQSFPDQAGVQSSSQSHFSASNRLDTSTGPQVQGQQRFPARGEWSHCRRE